MFKAVKVITVAAVLAVTGCGAKSGGGDDSEPKSLFSYWESDDGLIIDLRGLSLDREYQYQFYISYQDTVVQCNCDLRFFGENEAQGSYVLNSCTEDLDNIQGANCNALNHTGQYYNDGAELELVDSIESTFYY